MLDLVQSMRVRGRALNLTQPTLTRGFNHWTLWTLVLRELAPDGLFKAFMEHAEKSQGKTAYIPKAVLAKVLTWPALLGVNCQLCLYLFTAVGLAKC